MEKISVSIRVRPLAGQECQSGSPWTIDSNTINLNGNHGTVPLSSYSFDHIYGPGSNTNVLYGGHTKEIIHSAVNGFNGTVFAYGQTSSGKTHTMRGIPGAPGIIPLAIHDVFDKIRQTTNREFLLRVSYLEIYNEEINDLLAPQNRKLQVHENVEREIFVAGLREEIVVNPEQVLSLMETGEENRHYGGTNMNMYSSRSHTIFRMVIESREKQSDTTPGDPNEETNAIRVSTLNLVDLAGSERIAKTGAEGLRLKEGGHINKSLMVLGNVINKLSEGVEKNGGHVPYRDSKLTRILQPALGGNAKTAIICCVTPAAMHLDETKGTLQFASRAKKVTNCATVNEIMTDAALLKRQQKEIETLKQKLNESKSPHLEEEILSLRNTLLQMESEKELMRVALQEQEALHAERAQMIREQEQKIANLSSLVINCVKEERVYRPKKENRRETWCPTVLAPVEIDEESTPSSKDKNLALKAQILMPQNLLLATTIEESIDEENTPKVLTDRFQKRNISLTPLKESNGASSITPKKLQSSLNKALSCTPSKPSNLKTPTLSTPARSIPPPTGNKQQILLTKGKPEFSRNFLNPTLSSSLKQAKTPGEHKVSFRKRTSISKSLDLVSLGKISSSNPSERTEDEPDDLLVDRRAKSMGLHHSVVEGLQTKVKALELEKLYMQKELDDLVEQLRSYTSVTDTPDIAEELAQANEKIAEIQGQYEMAVIRLFSLRESEEKIASLSAECAEKQSLIESLENELKVVHQEQQCLLADIEVSTQNCTKCSNLEQEVNILKHTIEMQAGELTKLESLKERQVLELRDYEKQIKALRVELGEGQSPLVEKLEEEMAKNAEFKTRYELHKVERDSSLEDNEKLRKEIEKEKAEFKDKLQDKETQISQLHERNRTLELEMEELKGKLRKVEELNERKGTDVVELDAPMTHINLDTDRVNQREYQKEVVLNVEEEAIMKEITERAVVAEAERDKMKEEIQRWKKNLQKEKQDVEAMQDEMKLIKKENDELKEATKGKKVEDEANGSGKSVHRRVSEELRNAKLLVAAELENYKKGIESMAAQIAHYQANDEGLRIENEKLKRTLAELGDEARSQADDFRKQLLEKEGQCNEIMRELINLENLKNEIDQAYGELEIQLNNEKTAAAEAIQKLEISKQQHHQDMNQLRTELTSLRKEASEAKSKPAALEKEREALGKELEKCKAKQKDTETKLKIAVQEKSSIQCERANMEKELKLLRGQSCQLSREVNRRESMALSKRRESMAIPSSRGKSFGVSPGMEKSGSVRGKDGDKVQFEVRMLREAHEELEKANSLLEESKAVLEKRVYELSEELKDNIEGRKEKEIECENMKNVLSELEGEIMELKAQHKKLLDTLQATQQAHKEASARADELSGVMGEVAQLTEAQLHYDAELAEWQAKEKAAREDLALAHREITELEQNIATLINDSSEKDNLIGKLQAEVVFYQSNQKELLEKIEGVEKEKADERQKWNAEKEKEIVALQGRIELLSDQLEEVQKEMDNVQETSKKAEKIIQQKLAAAEKSRSEINLKLQKSVAQVEKYREESKTFNKENAMFLLENTKLEVALDSANCRIAVFKSRLAETDATNSLLRKAVIEGTKKGSNVKDLQMKVLRDRITELEEEVNEFDECSRCEMYLKEIETLRGSGSEEREIELLELQEKNRLLNVRLRKMEGQIEMARAWREEVKRQRSSDGSIAKQLKDMEEQIVKERSENQSFVACLKSEMEQEKKASEHREMELRQSITYLEDLLQKASKEKAAAHKELVEWSRGGLRGALPKAPLQDLSPMPANVLHGRSFVHKVGNTDVNPSVDKENVV